MVLSSYISQWMDFKSLILRIIDNVELHLKKTLENLALASSLENFTGVILYNNHILYNFIVDNRYINHALHFPTMQNATILSKNCLNTYF